MDRRDFLNFLGRSTVLVSAVGPLEALMGCSHNTQNNLPFTPLSPTTEDLFKISPEFSFEMLIKWGDKINKKEYFGFNNDFIAYVPFNSKSNSNEGLMWVNHEYQNPLIIHGLEGEDIWNLKTMDMVSQERKSVGGSILHLVNKNNSWSIIKNSQYNRRLDAFTPISFSNNIEVLNSKNAIGTFGNCAGGLTPWNTFLSCEENYQNFVGEVAYTQNGKRTKIKSTDPLSWDHVVDLPPEHYGWVVEINPRTGKAKKHTALGRFCHEGATCVKATDNRVVVYMGDDANDEHFYKFISDQPGSLDTGVLYVANIEKGQWLSLNYHSHPEFKKKFKNQLDLLIQTRTAAKILGATPLDRPEDCEVDPLTGAIYLNCTNNKKKGRMHGSIHKFVEENNDPLSLNFTHSVFMSGGNESGISCPDNMIFDKKGNLWITTDISDEAIGRGDYKFHGNNALYYIPMSGKNAGIAYRVAQAPIEAELTGPCFSPDGKTLFLSIQHPGGAARRMSEIKSHWPLGGQELPKSAVVCIYIPDSLLL